MRCLNEGGAHSLGSFQIQTKATGNTIYIEDKWQGIEKN